MGEGVRKEGGGAPKGGGQNPSIKKIVPVRKRIEKGARRGVIT